MSIEERALGIPDTLTEQAGESTVELARIWWAENAPVMNIRPAIEDPFFMGVILAETAWHFSQAYEASGQGEASAVFQRILAGFADANAQNAGEQAPAQGGAA